MSEQIPLPVGPELDAAVARALGWTLWQSPGPRWMGVAPRHWPASRLPHPWLPEFSSDPAAAWEIVEYLRRRGWDVQIMAVTVLNPPYLCVIERGDERFKFAAPTMPEAICRVVLLAADVLREGSAG